MSDSEASNQSDSGSDARSDVSNRSRRSTRSNRLGSFLNTIFVIIPIEINYIVDEFSDLNHGPDPVLDLDRYLVHGPGQHRPAQVS